MIDKVTKREYELMVDSIVRTRTLQTRITKLERLVENLQEYIKKQREQREFYVDDTKMDK